MRVYQTIDPRTIEVDEHDHDGPHAFVMRRGKWPPICDKCGLVALRNQITAKAIKLGCGYRSSPVFMALAKRLLKRNR